MKRGVYAILDTKANDITSQSALMLFRSPQVAIRMFADALQDKQTQIAQHPLDYDLIQLGELTEEGEMIMLHESSNESLDGTYSYYKYETIITGKALWAAIEQQREPAPHLREVK